MFFLFAFSFWDTHYFLHRCKSGPANAATCRSLFAQGSSAVSWACTTCIYLILFVLIYSNRPSKRRWQASCWKPCVEREGVALAELAEMLMWQAAEPCWALLRCGQSDPFGSLKAMEAHPCWKSTMSWKLSEIDINNKYIYVIYNTIYNIYYIIII